MRIQFFGLLGVLPSLVLSACGSSDSPQNPAQAGATTSSGGAGASGTSSVPTAGSGNAAGQGGDSSAGGPSAGSAGASAAAGGGVDSGGSGVGVGGSGVGGSSVGVGGSGGSGVGGSNGGASGASTAGSGGSGGGAVFAGPAMGFNPYNCFWTNATETQMRSFADAVAKNGMLAAGYQYVNLDEGWQSNTRDSSGVIEVSSLYKSGIKALADYVHGKGLKFGIYTAPGTQTCSKHMGSGGHETQDVNTYASWGVDYVKLDWCGADYSASGAAALAQKWKDAIAASGRPMVLSINAGADASVAPWASTHVNSWRVGDDICDTWLNKTGARNQGFTHCTDTTYQSGIYDYLTMNLDYLNQYSAKGHWGDPDMLQVGNGGLNLEEAKTHFSIWAMWSAPLISGTDPTKMNGSDIASKVLLNTEVIAIDQDPKNDWAKRVKNAGGMQIYKKTLAATGSYAVALINMNNSPSNITVNYSDLGLSTVTAMRDLWSHGDLTPSGSSYTANSVPAHGVVLLKVTGS